MWAKNISYFIYILILLSFKNFKYIDILFIKMSVLVQLSLMKSVVHSYIFPYIQLYWLWILAKFSQFILSLCSKRWLDTETREHTLYFNISEAMMKFLVPVYNFQHLLRLCCPTGCSISDRTKTKTKTKTNQPNNNKSKKKKKEKKRKEKKKDFKILTKKGQ